MSVEGHKSEAEVSSFPSSPKLLVQTVACNSKETPWSEAAGAAVAHLTDLAAKSAAKCFRRHCWSGSRWLHVGDSTWAARVIC